MTASNAYRRSGAAPAAISGQVGYTVSDLERSVALWREAFGFTVVEGPRPADPHILERCTGVIGAQARCATLRGSGLGLELLEYAAPTGAGHLRSRPLDAGFAYLSIEVDDIDAATDAARAHRAEPVGPVATVQADPAQGTRAIYVRDWDGCTIALLEPAVRTQSPPGAEWIPERQVHGLFAALDTRDPARVVPLLTEDSRLRSANGDPVAGRGAISDLLDAFWREAGIVDQHHEIRGIWAGRWEQGPVASVEAEVSYRLAHGRAATVQTTSTLRYRGDLVADYRIFGDLTPLSR